MRKDIGSKFIREICVAGAVIDVTLKYSLRAPRKPRGENRNPSRKEVTENNDRIALKKLTRLMNANFYPGDYHCTLTYEGIEPDAKEAKKELRNFLRRMKDEYQRRGKEFRWIAVTEYENTRIHHHIVLNFLNSEIIRRQWKRGHVRFTMLDRSRNYKALAEYLIKETTKSMRKPGAEVKQRWSASKNLVRPIIKREIIQAEEIYKHPKPFKGYEIIGGEEGIRTFSHIFTGIEHKEYMMISTDPVPRIKTWRKGTSIKRDESFRRADEIQISFDVLDGIYTV